MPRMRYLPHRVSNYWTHRWDSQDDCLALADDQQNVGSKIEVNILISGSIQCALLDFEGKGTAYYL